jgi:hypothetical protein
LAAELGVNVVVVQGEPSHIEPFRPGQCRYARLECRPLLGLERPDDRVNVLVNGENRLAFA